MSKDIPPAARKDGQTSADASEVQTPRTKTSAGTSAETSGEDSGECSYEELRRYAAGRLADNLELGGSFLERCEHLAELPQGDRLSPLYAAARLMHSSARVAESFAKVAQVESRSRRIVERVQPSVPNLTDSNLILENSLSDELRLKMIRYLTLLASEKLDPALEEAAAEDNALKNHALQKTPAASAPGSSADRA